MVRAFRNAGDNLRTYARIGNDAAQITNKAYWRLRENTVLRPCPNCTAESGKLSGTVGKPEEHEAGRPLTSIATEQPVELDGVLWMRVFLPYDWKRPVLGYDLGPQAVWIAPKDYLEGAAKPVDLKPTAPQIATWAGLQQTGFAMSPLLLVALTPFLIGLTVMALGGIGAKMFNARPNAAAAGATGTAAAGNSGPGNNNDGGDHGNVIPNGLFRVVLILGMVFILMPLLMLALSMLGQSGGRSLPNQPAIWMLTSSAMLTLLVVAVFVGSIPLVFFANDKWRMFKKCLFVLLIAFVLKLAVPDVSAAFTPSRYGPGASGQPISLALIPPAPIADTSIATLVQQAAAYHTISPELVAAICARESGCNANTPDGGDGEIGPMQIMPRTAAHY
ncbi:MAG: transglycosylase SLT domain-containing protein, partial [Kiritimatiellota bacterium]|nr:transglycosylase SLT domain-containing protein [Kiritimatiellota bacterium]